MLQEATICKLCPLHEETELQRREVTSSGDTMLKCLRKDATEPHLATGPVLLTTERPSLASFLSGMCLGGKFLLCGKNINSALAISAKDSASPCVVPLSSPEPLVHQLSGLRVHSSLLYP
jgi:hypothetical protein